MNVRALATAVATATAGAALTLALAACTPGTDASPTPSATLTAAPTNAPAPTPGGGEIRALVEGAILKSTADALRAQFPAWQQFDDTQVEQILNAGCDTLDAQNNPVAAAEAIAAYGIDVPGSSFGVLAAISNYCPEHSQFLTGG